MLKDNAPAKLNLSLRVLGRRPDGYHELQSLVSFAEVSDTVSLHPQVETGVAVDGPFADAIQGDNLLSRVIAEVLAMAPGLQVGHVRLDKHLPVAAGLGGGSADAAALLRLLRRQVDGTAAAARIDWFGIAARLGADVPVCLPSRPALMWGIGERIVELLPVDPPPQPLPAVLVNPGVPLATRDVFRALAAPDLDGPPQPPSVPRLVTIADVVAHMQSTGNDLERPALQLLPMIGEVKRVLSRQPGCLHVSLSGSGPTCLALFATAEAARAAHAAIRDAHANWWVVATRIAFPCGPALSSRG